MSRYFENRVIHLNLIWQIIRWCESNYCITNSSYSGYTVCILAYKIRISTVYKLFSYVTIYFVQVRFCLKIIIFSLIHCMAGSLFLMSQQWFYIVQCNFGVVIIYMRRDGTGERKARLQTVPRRGSGAIGWCGSKYKNIFVNNCLLVTHHYNYL